MPASYAHYRFGKRILKTLPQEARQCIGRFRRMYDLGLQGPDIFSYAVPVPGTSLGKLGKEYHQYAGKDFFPRACAAANTEAARAYLYGLLAHYCLDCACHPYILRLQQKQEARHIPLEAEFDRYLMELDGIKEPHRQDLSRFLKVTPGESMTISAFYPPAGGMAVHSSIRSMALAQKFLSGKNRETREKLLGKVKPGLCDFFVPAEPVTAWARMDSELLARFNRAMSTYPAMLEQLEEYLRSGRPLGKEFDSDFNGN